MACKQQPQASSSKEETCPKSQGNLRSLIDLSDETRSTQISEVTSVAAVVNMSAFNEAGFEADTATTDNVLEERRMGTSSPVTPKPQSSETTNQAPVEKKKESKLEQQAEQKARIFQTPLSFEVDKHYVCKQEIDFFESMDTTDVKHLGCISQGEIIAIKTIHPATEHSLMKLHVRFDLIKHPFKGNSGWIQMENNTNDTYFQTATVNNREQDDVSVVLRNLPMSSTPFERRRPTTSEADFPGNTSESAPSENKKKATQKSLTET
jgi:hypothetical protein